MVQNIPYEFSLCVESALLMIAGSIWVFTFNLWENFTILSVSWTFLFSAWVLMCVILWMLSSFSLSVGENSIIRSFDKVWGYIIGYLLLGESISTSSIIGSVLILIGILLLAFSKLENNQASESNSSVEMERSQDCEDLIM